MEYPVTYKMQFLFDEKFTFFLENWKIDYTFLRL